MTMQSATSTPSSSASRMLAEARATVLGLLKLDHQKIRRAFALYARLDPLEDTQRRAALAREACDELDMHAALEEELFYPIVRLGLDDTSPLDEAEVEHACMEQLIDDVRTLPPDDPLHAASVAVLARLAQAHMREEENVLFKRLARSPIDWDGLLDIMQARRQELLDEYDLQRGAALTAPRPPAPIPLRINGHLRDFH